MVEIGFKSVKNKKNCIICKKNTTNTISNKVREGHQKVFFCKNCNLAFLGDKNLKCESYLYSKKINYEIFSKERLESLKRNKSILKIKSIFKFKGKDILEVGPGLAPISSYFFNETKSNSILELDKTYQNFLKKKYKKKINLENEKNLNSFKKKFDLIILVHVFEHFDNPVYYLKFFENLLKRGGSIILIIPNLDDVYLRNLKGVKKKKYLEFTLHQGHKFYYTLKSIKKIINKYTKLKIKLNSTFQEYSIKNFFKWQFFSYPDMNLSSVIHDLQNDDLDNLFKSYCEKNNIGNSIILKASK